MPTRLWRYITADFWRLMLIATPVLVTVIAFAITIPPLADGKLTPTQAISFMGLAVVPMLAYAVPFGAGFAATIVYHRLAQDNEVTAAYAGGIGHRGVLAPAGFAGLVLAVVLTIIADQAIPRFLHSMQEYLKLDIADWMIVQLDMGQSFEFNGTLIAAEEVQTLDPAEVAGAEDARSLIALFKPAILFLDDGKRVETAATAEKAFLVVRRAQEQWSGPDAGAGVGADGKPRFGAVVSLIAQNYRGAGQDSIIQSEDQFRFDMAIPPVIGDDPKFFTLAELATLKKHPERFDFVDEWRHRLALRVASIDILNQLHASLNETGRAGLLDPQSGSVITIEARALGGPGNLRPIRPGPNQPVRVAITHSDGRTESLAAGTARLHAGYLDELTQRRPMLRLELTNVATTSSTSDADILRANDSDQPVAGVRKRRVLSGLSAGDPARFDALRAMGIRELLDDTAPYVEPDRKLTGPQEAYAKLDDLETKLQQEITANEHERFAMSFAGAVMVLTGAVVAIRLKDAIPLAVYLWAFFPALGSILTISMGKQLTHQFGGIGLIAMWAGVLIPFAYALWVYKGLCRR